MPGSASMSRVDWIQGRAIGIHHAHFKHSAFSYLFRPPRQIRSILLTFWPCVIVRYGRFQSHYLSHGAINTPQQSPTRSSNEIG